MLLKNNVDLKTFCEFARETNDVRTKIDWNRANNKRFIQHYSYAAFPKVALSTDFLNAGVNFANIAPIGTRPNLNLRASITTPGQYYIIKFADKSVRLTSNNVDYTSTPEGTVIGTALEDLKLIVVELQGGGGGGAGGGRVFAGTGGAGGGYILGLLNLEHEAGANWKKNSVPLQVGAGGAGVRDRKQAGHGQDTGFYINSSLALCASGGDGADGGTPGSCREVAIAGVDSIFYAFYSLNGNDGRDGGDDNSIGAATSPATGPNSENVYISWPAVSASGGYGGSGGCSRLGGGGDAYRDAGQNGGDGKGPGAGGGGGTGAPVSTGGNGINGLINFYY